MNIDELATGLHNAQTRSVERELIRIVEILEGRVPTKDEMTQHGLRRIYPDRTDWLWKGNIIVQQYGLTFADGRATTTVKSLALHD